MHPPFIEHWGGDAQDNGVASCLSQALIEQQVFIPEGPVSEVPVTYILAGEQDWLPEPFVCCLAQNSRGKSGVAQSHGIWGHGLGGVGRGVGERQACASGDHRAAAVAGTAPPAEVSAGPCPASAALLSSWFKKGTTSGLM